MDRFSGWIRRLLYWACGLLGLAGLVYGCILLYEGTRPCSGDGCMVHLNVLAAGVVFLISIPISIMAGRAIFRDLQGDVE